jgi:hypothetical protein
MKENIAFSYYSYSCGSSYGSEAPEDFPIWLRWYFIVYASLVTIVAYITVIITSIILMAVAKRAAARHGNAIRLEGVVAVLMSVGVLLFSNIPASIAIGVEVTGTALTPTTMRAVYHLQYLNVMANFFVYAFAVQSFREFLKFKIYNRLCFFRSLGQLRQERGHQSSPSKTRSSGHETSRWSSPFARRRNI